MKKHFIKRTDVKKIHSQHLRKKGGKARTRVFGDDKKVDVNDPIISAEFLQSNLEKSTFKYYVNRSAVKRFLTCPLGYMTGHLFCLRF